MQKQARALQPDPLADFPRDSMAEALREDVDAMTKLLLTVKDTIDKAAAKTPVQLPTMLQQRIWPSCPGHSIGPQDGLYGGAFVGHR